DEAISKSSKEGDEVNFNENRSFPDDEFLVPRNTMSHCSENNDDFPYVPAFDPFSTHNITIPDLSTPSDPITSSDPSDTPLLQDLNSPHKQPKLTIVNDHHVLNEHDDSESVKDLEISEDHVSIIIEPVSNVEPSPIIISPLSEVFINPLVPQDRWFREKHIELVNILGELHVGVTTRRKIRDSEAASTHQCLYVNFLSEIEPKKQIEALEEEGWIIAMQE
ncbi:hypothetical protein Tco_1074479, partial [Tanacetum coccineum]